MISNHYDGSLDQSFEKRLVEDEPPKEMGWEIHSSWEE